MTNTLVCFKSSPHPRRPMAAPWQPHPRRSHGHPTLAHVRLGVRQHPGAHLPRVVLVVHIAATGAECSVHIRVPQSRRPTLPRRPQALPVPRRVAAGGDRGEDVLFDLRQRQESNSRRSAGAHVHGQRRAQRWPRMRTACLPRALHVAGHTHMLIDNPCSPPHLAWALPRATSLSTGSSIPGL